MFNSDTTRDKLRNEFIRELVRCFNISEPLSNLEYVEHRAHAATLSRKTNSSVSRPLLDIQLYDGKSTFRIVTRMTEGVIQDKSIEHIYRANGENPYPKEVREKLSRLKAIFVKLSDAIIEDKKEILNQLSHLLSSHEETRYNVRVECDKRDGEMSSHVSLDYFFDTDSIKTNGRIHIYFSVIHLPIHEIKDSLNKFGINLSTSEVKQFIELMRKLELVMNREKDYV